MLKVAALGLLASLLLTPATLVAPSSASAAPALELQPALGVAGHGPSGQGRDLIAGGVPAAIDVIYIGGSGCPGGTAAVAVSADNSGFEIMFHSFQAAVGVGTKATDYRKNCQISLKIYHPTGYSYALSRIDYSGYAILAAGASATQRSNYYFSGQSPTAMTSHPFAGPMDGEWRTTDLSDVASLVFSPCGQETNLNINTELRVNVGSSDPRSTSSLMAMDSASTDTYALAWRTCD